MFGVPLVLCLSTSAVASVHRLADHLHLKQDARVNASKPIKSLAFSRMFRDLEERQACPISGYGLCQGYSTNCCPMGDGCCIEGSVVIGCCPGGYSCDFDIFGDLVCNPFGSQMTPTSSYTPPTSTYMPPTSTYTPPTSTYTPPTSTYTPPTSTYTPPTSTYTPPTSTYTPPSPPTISTPTTQPPTHSKPPQITPETSAATSFATTVTPSSQPSPTLTSSESDTLLMLYQCAPCGSNQCSFSAHSDSTEVAFSLIVGIPIENCEQGSIEPITNTITGSITLVDTWSVTASVGLNLGELRLGASDSWSEGKQITWSQAIMITIPPGYMGAMVANITYNQTSGAMNFGNGQTFPLLSNQPLQVVSYGSEVIPCGNQFPANLSTQFNCTSAAATLLTGSPLSMRSFAPVVVVTVLLSISLFDERCPAEPRRAVAISSLSRNAAVI